MTGANLLSQLCSVEPDVPPPEPVQGPGNAGPLQIAASGLLRFASRPWQLANLMPTTVATIVKTLRRARGGLTMAAPFAAPATRFNASVTADRNIALAQLDLDDIKKVKDRFNVTVMSLNGKLNVGIISCPDLVADLWRIADGFEVALEELLECASPARV